MRVKTVPKAAPSLLLKVSGVRSARTFKTWTMKLTLCPMRGKSCMRTWRLKSCWSGVRMMKSSRGLFRSTPGSMPLGARRML